MDRIRGILAETPPDVRVRAYVSTVTHCPYEGPTDPARVAALVETLLEWGCQEVFLGETIGMGTVADVGRVVEQTLEIAPVASPDVERPDAAPTAPPDEPEELDAPEASAAEDEESSQLIRFSVSISSSEGDYMYELLSRDNTYFIRRDDFDATFRVSKSLYDRFDTLRQQATRANS